MMTIKKRLSTEQALTTIGILQLVNRFAVKTGVEKSTLFETAEKWVNRGYSIPQIDYKLQGIYKTPANITKLNNRVEQVEQVEQVKRVLTPAEKSAFLAKRAKQVEQVKKEKALQVEQVEQAKQALKTISTVNNALMPCFWHSFTTKQGNTYKRKCIDYTCYYTGHKGIYTVDHKNYLWVIHCLRTVSKTILTRIIGMKSRSNTVIIKFLQAFNACTKVYFTMNRAYRKVIAGQYISKPANPVSSDYTMGNTFNGKKGGKKSHNYNCETALTNAVNDVFTAFSNSSDGFLVDLFEIALEKIPFNLKSKKAIGHYTIIAEKAIAKFLSETAKNEKKISIDGVNPNNTDSEKTETILAKISFEKWVETDTAITPVNRFTIDYFKNPCSIVCSLETVETAETVKPVETAEKVLTNKQGLILGNYAVTNSINKTADNFSVSKQAVSKVLKLARENFKQALTPAQKRVLRSNYRLLKYNKVFENDDRYITLKSFYNAHTDKNGLKYISIPYLTKIDL